MTNLEWINQNYNLYEIICKSFNTKCKINKCPFRISGGHCMKEKMQKENWLMKER